MNRRDKILQDITPAMRGLEIGPSYNPVVPKREGWNVQVIDHASQAELQQKYHAHPVNQAQIEVVDFICRDGDFLRAVPEAYHGTYDYIIASHMIEHTTDLVVFLNQMEQLLKSQGMLSLIIPDKCYCFDFFRPLTTTGDVLDAHFHKRTRHSKKTAFDHVANICSYKEQIIWGESAIDPKGFTLTQPLHDAMAWFDRVDDEGKGEYFDFHNWTFTPASFRLVLLELQALGKTGLSVQRHYPSHGGEFFIHLTRQKMALPIAQSDALQQMRLDLRLEVQQEVLAAMTAATPSQAEPQLHPAILRIKRIIPPAFRPLAGQVYRHCRPLLHRLHPA